MTNLTKHGKYTHIQIPATITLILSITTPDESIEKFCKNKFVKTLGLYTPNSYFYIPLGNNVYVDETTNTIKTWSTNPLLHKNLNEFLLFVFMLALTSYFIKKLKYKGKIFKIIRKRRKLFRFRFGKTKKLRQWIKITSSKIKKRKKKLKMFFFSANKKKLASDLTKARSLRPWNLYTQRGIRLGKQTIFKKVGKKSTYM